MSTRQGGNVDAEAVERQLQAIRDEVIVEPLLSSSERLSLTCKLAQEFQHDDAYYSQVLSLFNRIGEEAQTPSTKHTPTVYETIRYARRDGNCFYRCASFRIFELMLSNPAYADFCLVQIDKIGAEMVKLFGDYSTDFTDVVKEVIDKIKTGVVSTSDDVHAIVLSEDSSYLTVFFRYAVSVYLREHSDEFLPFVMGLDYGTVEGYCSAEVEPVDHESDNVQLVGLAKIFNLRVVVETLDRTTSGQRTTHLINAESRSSDAEPPTHTLYLLFRPGHYDLLELCNAPSHGH